jgi:hypothetical protein
MNPATEAALLSRYLAPCEAVNKARRDRRYPAADPLVRDTRPARRPRRPGAGLSLAPFAGFSLA